MAAAAHLEPYIGVAPPTFPCPPAAKFGAACGMRHVPGRSVRVGSYLTSKRDSSAFVHPCNSPLDLPSLAHPQLPSFEDDEQEYVHRPGPRPRPGNTAHTRLLSGAAAPLHVTLRSGGVPPRFTGASWHRWLPAGYCGKLLLATAASWLIQQNSEFGSVSV